MEQRLNALQTSLNVVETSITKFENLIEDWWRRSSAALRKTRPTRRRRRRRLPMLRWLTRKSAMTLSPLAPVWRLIPRTSLRWSPVEIPSPLRRKLSSCRKHPNLRIQQLDLTAPGARPAQSREGWSSYVSHPRATLGPRRMRPHNRSLPFSEIA